MITLFGFTFKNKIDIIIDVPLSQKHTHGAKQRYLTSEKGLTMNRAFKVRHKNKNVLMYASSETDANILYGTNFFCPDPFIFLRTADGKRHLVMSDLEIDRAKKQSNAHKVHSLAEYTEHAKKKFKRTSGVPEILATILRDFRIRSVTVPESFPLGIAKSLGKYNITTSPLPEPFYPERIYKKPAEVAEVKRAMRATEKGIKAAIDALRASRIKNGFLYYKGKKLTAEILRNIINTTVLSLGYLPSHTIVAPGKQGCDPHDQGSGIIRAHEPIIIDVFPRSEATGYFADITRTVVRGTASDEVKRMYRTVYDGQKLGLDMIKHGVKARKVHRAIQRLFERNGYHTGEKAGRMQGFFHGTGHALGLEIHEPPRIALNNITLEKGMVLTVEPGLYYYPVGGVRIEDTVLVTRTGIDNLTRFPKFLEI
ncbi:MAG: aminopeptidase P family protein [Candidatus Latescibacterota bacterium]|nr:MAG: aminopeptidase P family protein [Candidatus Latescibacterota bacterium]